MNVRRAAAASPSPPFEGGEGRLEACPTTSNRLFQTAQDTNRFSNPFPGNLIRPGCRIRCSVNAQFVCISGRAHMSHIAIAKIDPQPVNVVNSLDPAKARLGRKKAAQI